jgi:hypothetical protein
MTDKKDETGKGPAKPGDASRRPYATIDLQATEVGGKDKGGTTGSAKPASGPSALPPPGAGESKAGRSGLAARLASARGWSRRAAGDNAFLSHVASGVAGGILVFAASALFGLLTGTIDRGPTSPEVEKRLAELEQLMRQRSHPLVTGEVAKQLAQADSRLKGLEDQTRTIAALSDAQTKLQATIKALEGRSSSPEYVNRVAKLETALAALSAGDKSGTQAAALADKLTELEKLVGDATEASKSGAARADRDLAVLKTDASRLGQRLDTFKSDVDERLKGTAKSADLASVTAKLAAFEQDLQGFLKGEGERTSNAARVLLTLEIANLKRAMDRGDRYAAELDAVRKAGGATLKLAPLERYSLEGAPALPTLAKDFRHVANAAIDAEAEPADASVLDRLVSGARSIVRVRKAGHDPADASTEAVVGRMEAALKDGRLGEVLEQGKKLPPKAALAAEDWLKKVEARHAVDRAIADIETALKSSLGARPASAPEPKR